MKKVEFIKKFSKIEDTFEDEFRAEFNSPELIWEALKEQLSIHDFSYCVEQTKNVLTNKFCNIAKKHAGKTFDEVPEVTELLKAIDVIEKHCS